MLPPNSRLRAEQDIMKTVKRMPDAHFIEKIKNKAGTLSLTQNSS